MSIKYFCDRCGKEIPVHNRAFLQVRNCDGDLNGEMMVCTDCLKNLKEWKENKDGAHRLQPFRQN
jgi:predicted SprT family Zn-dependent metalloprotease